MFSIQLSTSSAALDLAPLSQTPPRSSYIGRAAENRDKPSEWPQFNGNARRPESLASRNDRRNVTTPLGLSPGLGEISPSSRVSGTASGTTTPLIQQIPQGLTQGLSSRRGSPLLMDEISITTARSVPATPLPGVPGGTPHLKAPTTPLSAEVQHLNGLLSVQGARGLNESPVNELHPSLSRVPSSQYDSTSLTFTTLSGDDAPVRKFHCSEQNRRLNYFVSNSLETMETLVWISFLIMGMRTVGDRVLALVRDRQHCITIMGRVMVWV